MSGHLRLSYDVAGHFYNSVILIIIIIISSSSTLEV